ncbi:MAG TPA: hypothetical protein VMV09_01805 [Candidatus Saccharimonadales bacterium]|nr:hypothetical protein [Candidatus Saccharimonadales bacterium]
MITAARADRLTASRPGSLILIHPTVFDQGLRRKDAGGAELRGLGRAVDEAGSAGWR